MPVVDDLELPIRHVVISGPAIDALDKRKEHSTNPRIEVAELRASFDEAKDRLFSGLKSLARALVSENETKRSGW